VIRSGAALARGRLVGVSVYTFSSTTRLLGVDRGMGAGGTGAMGGGCPVPSAEAGPMRATGGATLEIGPGGAV